jgi:hypothetical protein
LKKYLQTGEYAKYEIGETTKQKRYKRNFKGFVYKTNTIIYEPRDIQVINQNKKGAILQKEFDLN